MSLLDIAIAHSSIQTHLGYTRVQLFINGNIPIYPLLQHEERWASSRKSIQNTGNLNFGLVHFKKSCPGFLVSAVATLEPKCLVLNKDTEKDSNALSSTAELESRTVQKESSSGGSEEVDEREKLRRLRISKANRGNTPWNKGRKHSPETLRRIKERTRLAMQSPKVKMKLASMGHAQSPETRVKIAAGVRMGWQKRREMLMLQETCLFDWQNLIAETARGGFLDEEELQWDSYDILSKQLQQEWLESIEHRKSLPRPKGSKRAPKSLEQRRKIAEAIAAKWADPAYRSRVCTGLAKYHGIPEGGERKVRRKPSGEDSTNTSRKKSEKANIVNGSAQLPKLKKRNVPKYKDPLSTSKLEMLKSIRAQRGASETMKVEALERAKLLIAEAQKAAKALEVAATRSPVARASLIEAYKLIAEATQSIKSIENGELPPQDNVQSVHQDYAARGGEPRTEDPDQRSNIGVNGKETMKANLNQEYHKMVNGFRSMKLGEDRNLDTDLYQKHNLPTSLGGNALGLGLASFAENEDIKECMEKQGYPLGKNGVPSVNGFKLQSHEEHAHPTVKSVTKKWVRGRLVEAGEGVVNNDSVSD